MPISPSLPKKSTKLSAVCLLVLTYISLILSHCHYFITVVIAVAFLSDNFNRKLILKSFYGNKSLNSRFMPYSLNLQSKY